MTNKHTHQNHALVFSSQSHLGIEQILASSAPVQTAQRTHSGEVAGMSRSHPLDAEGIGISRVSARLPAKSIGEWPRHSTHTDLRTADNIRTRPDSASTHNRLSGSKAGSASHARRGVTLLQFNLKSQSESRPQYTRPDTGTNSHPSGHTIREHTPTNPDSSQKAFTHAKRPPRGVRQDKAHLESAPSATPQPSPVTKVTLSLFTKTEVVRSQNVFGAQQKSSRVSFWADPGLKERLTRKAYKEGLSVSGTCAAFLRKSLQEDIDLEYSATLEPIIDRSIARSMRSLTIRLTWLLVRIAFDAGQTRSLVTNILGRQQGVTQPLLKTILEGSGRSAKANIMRRTPQITSLISSVEKWMTEDEAHGKKPV